MKASRRLYRLFLRLYPAEFRERYGVPLERQFADELSEADGWLALLRLWMATIRDLAMSIPAQLAREITQDVRHTLRLWRRRPMPVVFAIAILAVAMGATTGMFSVVNALLLRALPFHEPDRLAALHNFGPPPEFDSWRRQSSYLADAASYDTTDVNVETASQAVRVTIAETSSNFFALLGTRAASGRTFVDGEDAPGRNGVAVIGYALWQRLYGGDAAAVGSSLRINGVPLTIVGVAPPRFDYPQRAEIWTPTTFELSRIPKTGSIIVLTTIGRLRTHVTWPQARAAFEAEAFARDPDSRRLDALNHPALRPLQEELAAPTTPAMLVLLAGVALLLVLACANVANLLLARTVARSNELAIRMALGASRGRLVQQLMTETMLMSVVATAVGCAIARWSADILASVQPATLASQAYTVLDWRVLTFAAALSIATGLAFGVVPAIFASRAIGAIHQRTATAAVRHTRMRNVLIAAQMAVTVALLSGSVALARAFITILRADLGYELASIATLTVSLAGTPHDGEAAWPYLNDVFSRIRAVPGVTAVSGTELLPLNVTGFMAGHFNIEGHGPAPLTLVIRVAPSFFATMHTRLLAGREFSPDDLVRRPALAVVNETLARQFGGPSSVVGRRLTADRWTPMEIVGVVGDLSYIPGVTVSTPAAFVVSRAPHAMTIVAHVQGSAGDRLAAVRDAVRSVDAKVAVFDAKTMDEWFGAAIARPRFYVIAVVFFGGVGLLLSIIGVYGVVSFAVITRTREMGVRLALGTTPQRLRAWMLRHTLAVVMAGSAAGVGLSMAFGRYLQSLIAGATSFGISGSCAAVGMTLAIASAAIWSATRRVARLDISDVLRAESGD
jgi:predicted permease